MISKSEFLSRVRMEVFPKLDEKKFNSKRLKRDICLLLYAVFLVVLIYFKSIFQFLNFRGKDLSLLFVLPVCIWIYFDTGKSKIKENLFKMLDLPQKDFYGFSLENEDYYSDEAQKSVKEKNRLIDASCLFKRNVEKAFFSYGEVLPFNSEMACFETEISIPSGKSDFTFFKGLFIEIKQNQFYEMPIVFAQKGTFNSRKGLKKVQLRVSDKYFDIYSNDLSTAQSLYHQQVASKLLRIKNSFNVKKVEASFYQDKLFIALYTNKNLFEPIKKRFLDIKQYEQFYDEIAEIENYCKQFTDL